MRTIYLSRHFESAHLLAAISQKRVVTCKANSLLFRTGDVADSVYHVERGQVKISRISASGREAIVGLLTSGDFVGEGCLIGQPVRLADAVCLTDSQLTRIDKDAVLRLLRSNSVFAEDFMAYLLSRNSRYQDDLEDQLVNSARKRLARTLLLLAHLGGAGEASRTIPHVSHYNLAQIVGTTRAHISQFMSSFRKSGFIDYNRRELVVRSSLLNVILGDTAPKPGCPHGAGQN